MTLGYPRNDMVLGLKGQRLGVGYSSVAWVQTYECLCVSTGVFHQKDVCLNVCRRLQVITLQS